MSPSALLDLGSHMQSLTGDRANWRVMPHCAELQLLSQGAAERLDQEHRLCW
jgi:hypothetical protein